MRRPVILAICLTATQMVAPAFAGNFQDTIVEQLKSQGFTDLSISTTWLGRTRVTASTKNVDREVIFNAHTGEILRDYSETLGTPEVELLDTSATTTETTDSHTAVSDSASTNSTSDNSGDGSSGSSDGASGSGGSSGSGSGDDG